MLQRFTAGTAVASIAVAVAAVILTFIPGMRFERIYPVTIVWCCVPLAWGVWAVLTPRPWMPKKLPLWGALLGLFAGSMAAFVLNLPARFLGEPLSVPVRAIAVVVMSLFYYLMWMLVRTVYRRLTSTTTG
jgi:hypothetical protein